MLFPAIGGPVVAGPLAYPATSYPDVLMAIPVPIPWGPDKAHAWRRDLDHLRRRRSNVDFCAVVHRLSRYADGGHAAGEQNGSDNADQRLLQRACRLS